MRYVSQSFETPADFWSCIINNSTKQLNKSPRLAGINSWRSFHVETTGKPRRQIRYFKLCETAIFAGNIKRYITATITDMDHFKKFRTPGSSK
jgi:hypothetical protein